MQRLSTLAITPLACSLIDRWLVTVTPSVVTVVIRLMSDNSVKWQSTRLYLLLLKILSVDLALLSFTLFAWAHCSAWSSSADLDWRVLAGITIYAISVFIYVVAGNDAGQVSGINDVWDVRQRTKIANLYKRWSAIFCFVCVYFPRHRSHPMHLYVTSRCCCRLQQATLGSHWRRGCSVVLNGFVKTGVVKFASRDYAQHSAILFGLCRGYMWSEISSKLFQSVIAAHKYFPVCSISQK